MKQPLVRVLVVDDSAFIRSVIRGALGAQKFIQVVGEAVDGVDALRKIATLRPDVVTLDVEMPRMNGLGVLERAAGKVPVSFVMVSTLTRTGAQITFEALNKGAFDYVAKPTAASEATRSTFLKGLITKVLAASRSKGKPRRLLAATGRTGSAPTLPPNTTRGWVVALGISCGGPQTLYEMLPAFPSDFVPMVITQHMPASFTGPFASHLNQVCAMNVREARDGEPLQQGTILVAPGSHHMKVRRRGINLQISLDGGPLVSGHKPSVDVMFDSVAAACGKRCVGVIMTGMGADGAKGIVTLSQAGAITIGQDEATSLVYGMPAAAAKTGHVQHVVPLSKIPETISRLISGGNKVTGRIGTNPAAMSGKFPRR